MQKTKAQKSPRPKTKSQPDPTLAKAALVVGGVVTLAIVILHIVRVFYVGGLWRDEIVSVNIAKFQTLSEALKLLSFESFPIFVHLVLKLWMGLGFGDSDIALRALGCLVGISILGIIWLNGRALGYSVPLLSLILVGMNSWTIQYGDSIRAYGLGVFLILLTFGLIWKVTESPTPGRILMATIAAVLSVHCMYQNAIFLLAICLGGIIVSLFNGKLNTAVTIVSIGIVSAVTLTLYLDPMRVSRDLTEIVKVQIDLDRIWSVLIEALGSPKRFLLWIWAGLFAAGITVGVWSIFWKSSMRLSRERRDLTVFCTVVMVATSLGFLIFLKVLSYISEPWYFVPPMALVALSLDSLIAPILKRSAIASIAGISFVVLLSGFLFPSLFESARLRFTNVDLIAQRLEGNTSRDDMILVNPWFCGTTFQRYYKGHTPWMTAPPLDDHTVQRVDLLKQKMMEADPLRPDFEAMKQSLEAGNRVWLVGGVTFPEQGQLPPELPPAPNGPGGWYSGYYLYAWNMQLGHFINSHVSVGEAVDLNIKEPISPYESMSLTVFKGWRP